MADRKYRAGVIGLGWMGLLYDLARRIPDRFEVDDVDRPTPQLDVHRRIHHHTHPGKEGLPDTYSEALWDRPEVELVAGADRDQKRLAAFRERYGIDRVYTDALEMLEREALDIVAIATNTKGRSFLTCEAVRCGAKGILTDKPMAHTLEEADRMVKACADAGVPLSCGAITTTHPSFARARDMIRNGDIGSIVSLEADGPCAQHQNWSYFLDAEPAWLIGYGDQPRRDSGSDEFCGQGLMVCHDGRPVFFRHGSAQVRITGTRGELLFDHMYTWHYFKGVDEHNRQRVEYPWPDPQMVMPYGAVYSLNDVLDCMEGRLDEPKNSGRRVARALEVEVGLKLSSAQGGLRVDLPLKDRTLGLNYDWFR